jgi:hypothetical protein
MNSAKFPNLRKPNPMLKLNVGTNRKVGQPDFGSAGASCNLELELDTALFQDLEGLQQVVRRAYAACNQAVQDELARIAGDTCKNTQPQEVIEVRTTPTISGASVTRIPAAQFTNQPSPRPATASQVKAIRAIAARRKIDLVGMLRERFGLTTADELGIRQASSFIDELKSDERAAARARTATGPTRRLEVPDDCQRPTVARHHARQHQPANEVATAHHRQTT